MIISSQLLNMLPIPRGGDIEIPETLVPGIELSYPVVSGGTANVVADMRGRFGSAFAAFTFNQPASTAGGQTTVARFDKGYYEIVSFVHGQADFLMPLSMFPGFGLFYQTDTAAVIGSIMDGQLRANIPDSFGPFHQHLLFTKSGSTLECYYPTTGVGQNLKLQVDIYIRMLI